MMRKIYFKDNEMTFHVLDADREHTPYLHAKLKQTIKLKAQL